MAVVWLPIANDPGVLPSDGAVHAPIARRVRENFAERLIGHVYHAGAQAWPVGLLRTEVDPPGFRQPDIGTDITTQGVQASTHPLQWLCALEWDVDAQWATLQPSEWLVRLHLCAVARGADVHCVLLPVGARPGLSEPGVPDEQTLALPGYFLLPGQTTGDDPDVLTVDIPLEEIGGTTGQPFGVPELGYRLWILSSVGAFGSEMSGLEDLSPDRRLLTVGDTPGPRWVKGHSVLRLLTAGRDPEGDPSTIVAPAAQTLYLVMATDGTSQLLLYPSVSEPIANVINEDDLYELAPVGYIVATAAHVELAPRRVVEMASSGGSLS